MNDPGDNAVGIFDSGLGGLTVVKAVKEALPNENVIYYGDTARVPYGIKSKETIIRYSLQNARILTGQGVKCIIVACNSSSSFALPALRKEFAVPVLGVIRPGVVRALELTRNGKIGVIATSATVSSGAYQKQIRKLSSSAEVFSRACPLFVPLVEEGWFDEAPTRSIAEMYLKDFKSRGVDTLILGCTHYPLLKETLQSVMGSDVWLIDSARTVAGELEKLLRGKNLLNPKQRKGRARFFVSDKPQSFREIARRFLGENISLTVKRA